MTSALISRLTNDTTDDAEYWRGVYASLEWHKEDAELADEPSPAKPSEPEPSQFWSGWNTVARLSPDVHEIDEALALVEARREGWCATHRIVFRSHRGESTTWYVMFCEEHGVGETGGPAYSAEEWLASENASWCVDEDGNWLCEGQATPSGENGEVEVHEVGQRTLANALAKCKSKSTRARMIAPDAAVYEVLDIFTSAWDTEALIELESDGRLRVVAPDQRLADNLGAKWMRSNSGEGVDRLLVRGLIGGSK